MIEILVVMAIFVIIAGFALFVSMDSFRGFSFRSERDTIITLLQKARSQAVSNVCLGSSCADGKAHGVHYDLGIDCHPGSRYYLIFQGSTFAGRDSAVDECVSVNSNAAVTMSGDIIFNQLDGASNGGTVNISADFHSSTTTITSDGQIIWTN